MQKKSEITFDSFPSGKHEIFIRGKFLGGNWGPEVAVDFSVFPPYWRSSIAIAIYLILASLIFFGFLYYRYVQNKVRRQLYEEKDIALHSLKENEEILRLSLDASRQGVWDWNSDSDEVHRTNVNNLVGAPFEKSLFKHWEKIHDTDRLHVISAWQSHIFSCERYHVEYRVVSNNETIHTLTVIANYKIN